MARQAGKRRIDESLQSSLENFNYSVRETAYNGLTPGDLIQIRYSGRPRYGLVIATARNPQGRYISSKAAGYNFLLNVLVIDTLAFWLENLKTGETVSEETPDYQQAVDWQRDTAQGKRVPEVKKAAKALATMIKSGSRLAINEGMFSVLVDTLYKNPATCRYTNSTILTAFLGKDNFRSFNKAKLDHILSIEIHR